MGHMMESSLKYTKFISEFLIQTGTPKYVAAAKAGISRQALYHWFSQDDAMLSSVEKLIGACGYTVRFELVRLGASINSGAAELTIVHRSEETDGSRLAFLDSAIKRYGIVRKEAAELLGVGYTTLHHWFRADDLYISYIYKIAKAYGLNVKIKIDPIR